MANVINGGAHSDAPIDFQEFMIMPLGLPTFSEGLRAITETFHALKAVLKKKGCSTAVGDEGGFAPKLDSVEEALETIIQAIKDAGYKPGKDIYLTLDPAASEFYNGNAKYTFKKSTGETVTGDDLVSFYAKLVRQISRSSASKTAARESDWATWKKLTDKLGDKIQLVGDDIFVTNVKFLQQGHRHRHGQFDSREGEPDRLAHRNARRRRTGQDQRLHRRHQPSLRRNRGRHHCGHRGGDQLRPDQDRLAQPHATAWRNTTSSCASSNCSARTPFMPAPARCRREAGNRL